MNFKQFDIDYDKITIDGACVQKPDYVSVSQWTEFWDQFDGEAVQRKVSDAWNEGFNQSEKEHEKELEANKRYFAKELENFSNSLRVWVNDNTASKDEFSDYIMDETDRIVGAVWRS